jgi:hypothetical protein
MIRMHCRKSSLHAVSDDLDERGAAAHELVPS